MGRALIHTVLVRRGLTRTAVLPISLVLLTRSSEYVEGLTAYRYDGPETSPQALVGVSSWLRHFLQEVQTAAVQATTFATQLDEPRRHWEAALTASRRARDLPAAPRADSATARILETLQENPMLTVTTVSRLFGVSDVATKRALDELAEAHVLTQRALGARAQVYLSMDAFELLTLTERRLASTRRDTRQSPPDREAPALPRA